MKLLALLVALSTLCIMGCSSMSVQRGRVESLKIEPAKPGPGERVRVYIELYDPYITPAVDELSYLYLDYSVTGGLLEGRTYDFLSDSAETISGPSIRALAGGATYWTLPDTPGKYALTAYWDAGGKTISVRID